jgi:hypothetical protein
MSSSNIISFLDTLLLISLFFKFDIKNATLINNKLFWGKLIIILLILVNSILASDYSLVPMITYTLYILSFFFYRRAIVYVYFLRCLSMIILLGFYSFIYIQAFGFEKIAKSHNISEAFYNSLMIFGIALADMIISFYYLKKRFNFKFKNMLDMFKKDYSGAI